MNFWNDKNKQDIELLYEQLRKIGSRTNIAKEKQDEFEQRLIEVHNLMLSLRESSDLKALEGLKNRLDALELWRGELHRMLVEQSPVSGRPKLSKTGKFLRTRF
jgi:predicted RNase H-like nuclease (RuvC/YqgF family)